MVEEVFFDNMDLENLPLNREFKIRMTLTGGEKKYQFINSFYDRYFMLARIEMSSSNSTSGSVVSLIKLQEIWAEYANGTWARRLELHNTSSQTVSFALVVRILDYP